MKTLQLVAIALLSLSSATWAQSGASRADEAAPASNRYLAAPTPVGAGDRIVHNANDCPPDRADPVWGANAALLGYTCVTPR